MRTYLFKCQWCLFVRKTHTLANSRVKMGQSVYGMCPNCLRTTTHRRIK